MRRRVVVVMAIAMAALVATAQPAAAASTNVAYIANTTDTELSTAQTLDNLTVTGTGAAAVAELREDVTRYKLSNVEGSASRGVPIIGDYSTDDPIKAETEIQPTTNVTATALDIEISGTTGSDYSPTVDVYIAEETPDGTYAEGTQVATFTPSFTTGEQRIPLDTHVDLEQNTAYTVAFVTRSTDSDGTQDSVRIQAYNAPGLEIQTSDPLSFADEAGGVTVRGAGDATYQSQHTVTETDRAFANVTAANNVSYTVNVTDSGGTVLNKSTFASAGNQTLTYPTEADQVNTTITVTRTGFAPEFNLSGEGVGFVNTHPTVNSSTATPAGVLDQDVGAFEINVSDGDFSTAQGDTVNASLYVNGTFRGSDQLTANGTATVPYSFDIAGNLSYQWRLTDEYGGDAQSQTFQTRVPGDLEIRNETDPSQLVTAPANVTVRFFGGGDTVIEKQTSTGEINLTGLPADERFVASIDADGYQSRRIVIPSLYEQQTVYILPDSANSVEVVFEIESPTGQFPPDETVLSVQKPITRNNTTAYRTVSADTFGATGQYPADMIPGERYRLRVESTDGSNSRVLGAYVPVASRVETLQIQRVEPQSDADPGQVVYGGLTSFNNSSAIAVRHRDLGDSVDSVQYRIEYANGTVAVPNTTETADEFAAVYLLNLSNQTNVTVFYEAQLADGATVTGSFSTGVVAGPVGRFGADPQVLSIVSWVAILATMGLLVIINTDIAPVGGVAVATGLTILGTVAIPLPILGLSGVLAALNAFGGGVGR